MFVDLHYLILNYNICIGYMLTRRPLMVLKSCFCNRFPFCLYPYFQINRKLIILLETTKYNIIIQYNII